MADANNAFLTYDGTTGLKIKNKAEIMQDLTSFFQAAYGGDLIIQEGTEVYTFVDLLSTGISNIAASVKGVWDAFSFIGASGASLDILCNAFGISRYEGETDEQLRSRYYISLFSKSVGTMDGLRAKLSNIIDTGLVYIDGGYQEHEFEVKEVLIKEYLDDASGIILQEPSYSTGNFPAHSIVPIIKLFNKNTNVYVDEFVLGDNRPSGSILDTLHKTIENYKSLGCISKGDASITNTTKFNGFYYATPLKIGELKLPLYWFNNNDKSVFLSSLYHTIRDNIKNYVKSLKINESVTKSGILTCIYQANMSLIDRPLVELDGNIEYKIIFPVTQSQYSTLALGIPIGLTQYNELETITITPSA